MSNGGRQSDHELLDELARLETLLRQIDNTRNETILELRRRRVPLPRIAHVLARAGGRMLDVRQVKREADALRKRLKRTRARTNLATRGETRMPKSVRVRAARPDVTETIDYLEPPFLSVPDDVVVGQVVPVGDKQARILEIGPTYVVVEYQT